MMIAILLGGLMALIGVAFITDADAGWFILLFAILFLVTLFA